MVARTLTCAVLLCLFAAPAAAADRPPPRSTEREDRDRRAKAALALAATATGHAAATPAVAPAPREAAPKSYAECHAKAIAERKPLVVYVSCESRPVPGADVCETKADTFGDVKGPAVVVCVPQGDRLTIDAKLDCPATAAEVKKAVDDAAKKMGGDGPPRPMPAAPKPLDWQIHADPPAGCPCALGCACDAGRACSCGAYCSCVVCPGKPAAAKVVPAAPVAQPVVVGYQYHQVCDGRSCRLVAVPVYATPAPVAVPGVTAQFPFPQAPGAGPGSPDGSDPLAELNAKRAARGLRPYLRDEGLTAAALACAKYRADRLMFQHTSNDFAFCPPGVKCDATGCSAYPASYGFLSCAMWDSYRFAGAASVMGRDGRMYHSLFVRQ